MSVNIMKQINNFLIIRQCGYPENSSEPPPGFEDNPLRGGVKLGLKGA
jgi:hypothetical protein